jgi:prepilin-type processing-associated H-X9-DG protein
MTTFTKMSAITDGTSNTVMIGEKHIQLGFINDPIQDGMIFSGSEQQTYSRRGGPSNPLAISNTTAINNQFGSWHTGVCQFVFADGSVRPIKNSIPGTTLGLLTNKSDGLVITDLD